jgi:hypothetical protein
MSMSAPSGRFCRVGIKAALVGAAVALLPLQAASGQTDQDVAACRIIGEAERRLDCYDQIPLAPSRGKYEALSLDELRSDVLSYRGRLVAVDGWLKPERDHLLIGAAADDPRPLPVEFESLSRRQREAVLERCSGGCQATVQGTVRAVNFTTGIVADAIVVH